MTDKTLTPRQAEVLAWIRKFMAEKGYAPTRAEIAGGMAFASRNAAEDHLKALKTKGAIRMTTGVARSIVLEPEVVPKGKRVTS